MLAIAALMLRVKNKVAGVMGETPRRNFKAYFIVTASSSTFHVSLVGKIAIQSLLAPYSDCRGVEGFFDACPELFTASMNVLVRCLGFAVLIEIRGPTADLAHSHCLERPIAAQRFQPNCQKPVQIWPMRKHGVPGYLVGMWGAAWTPLMCSLFFSSS
jgi:hypothetical protein